MRTSADPEQRAIAAQVLGYVSDKQDVVEDLLYGAQDPAGAVRNNAIRALWAISILANEERDSLFEEYQRTEVVLTPTARQEKQTAIQQLQTRIEQRGQDLQNRQVERERELMDPLEQRVQAVIEGIRAERNLGIVFDVAAMPGIAAVDQTLDLTTLVVQRLKQSQN